MSLKNNIKSSIKKDDNTGLYELILPGIKRCFEGIIINQWVRKIYWEFHKVSMKDSLYLDNYAFWISSFFDYKIACFIDLNSMNSKYFFFIDSKIFNFEILWKKYFCFVYLDYKWKRLFYSDYKWKDFIIKLNKKEILVKNNIFWTEIIREDISNLSWLLKNTVKLEKKKEKYIDIADFYIFDDYFTKVQGYEEFYDFLSVFSDKDIKINKDLSIKTSITKYSSAFVPKFKINVSVYVSDISSVNIEDFRKILLCFETENILSYIIDNDDIKKYFSKYIKDLSTNKLESLDFNYDIPKNIYETNSKFIEFKRDILLLRYNYFKLKESISKISNVNTGSTNSNIELSSMRSKVVEKNMKNTLVLYENKLREILSLIK